MIESITSRAIARFICDAPGHDFEMDPAPEFSGRTMSDCARYARQSGWKLSKKGGKCFCPKHQTTYKPPPSLFAQAMEILEAVTNPSGMDPAQPITDHELGPNYCVFCGQCMNIGYCKHNESCIWVKARVFIEKQRENALHKKNEDNHEPIQTL